MKPSPSHNIITNISTDKELVANFMEYMQLITKQTGVELIIDTEHK
ncbi:MAG: hypothetical protein LBI53_07585 [Candidatus Peribacteria bacterium]|jgi:Arc/MetJ family transcription regulator|nr:hypothetical protein [Candidatus Peribacteria bacterium]